jgi:hypothetical protein
MDTAKKIWWPLTKREGTGATFPGQRVSAASAGTMYALPTSARRSNKSKQPRFDMGRDWQQDQRIKMAYGGLKADLTLTSRFHIGDELTLSSAWDMFHSSLAGAHIEGSTKRSLKNPSVRKLTLSTASGGL